MMNKKNFSYKMKKNLALGMAALSAFGTVAGSAVTVHAEPVDEVAEANNVGDPLPAMEKALIKNGIGQIPVIGGVLSDTLDPFFAEILGVNPDNTAILDKLDEIKSQIDHLSLQMTKEIQDVLAQIYKNGLDSFNLDITSVRGIEVQLLDEIATIKADNNLTELEKALRIGSMLDPSSAETGNFVNKLKTCARYVSGQAINLNPAEGGIFTKAFNAKCQESRLVGEAAMKVAPYLNCVDTVIENGFKLEAMVLDAKMVARQILAKMSQEERDNTVKKIIGDYGEGSKEVLLLKMCKKSAEAADPNTDSTMHIWKKAAGIMENGHYTGAKGEYELICNANNPESVVGRYNAMITKEWFDFIESATIKNGSMEIKVIPLSNEIDATDYKDMGVEDFAKKPDAMIIRMPEVIVSDAINRRFNIGGDRCDWKIKDGDIRRTDVLSGVYVPILLSSLEKLPQNKDKSYYEMLKDYGFDTTTSLKKNSERYGVSAQNVNNLSEKELLDATKPVMVQRATEGTWDGLQASFVEGFNLMNTQFCSFPAFVKMQGVDKTYHKLLCFTCKSEKPLTLTVEEANSNVNTDELDAEIEAGFQLDTNVDSTPTENKDNKDNKDKKDESIVLTVDENGQISGDKMNEAWSVAEDGTIILNKDNKFRFEGTVTDKKIQNNGEIVDGNFKNVKLELVDAAKITKGTFDDCDITTNEKAVISDEVQLINSSVIDVKDMENKDNDKDHSEDQKVMGMENKMF